MPTWGSKFADRLEPLARQVRRVDPRLGAQSADPKRAIAESDTVLFAVTPDEQINAIASEHGEAFHPDQVCIECSTTKRQIAETLHGFDRRGMSVCSIHPGARADLPARGQNMLIMPVGTNGEAAQAQARELAALLQMNPIEFITLAQHARAMAVTQTLDHALQRGKIHALAATLKHFGLTFAQAETMAFANTRIGALGTGRVAIQAPSVSAKIIRESQASDDTRIVLDALIAALTRMRDGDATALVTMFQADMDALDKDGSWREKMLGRTRSVLEQMANLDIRGMGIYSPENKPGTLEKIAGVLSKNGINITAITSHNLEPEEGRTGVVFLMGIDENSAYDLERLKGDLAKIGASEE